jgi:hypothetical protein
MYAWGERNHFPTRTFPAGENEFKAATLETLKITGDKNAMLTNSRPSFTRPGAVLLRFRELEGRNAEVKLSSAVPGRTVKKLTEVNAAGKTLGQPIGSVQLKPFEVKFIEVEF